MVEVAGRLFSEGILVITFCPGVSTALLLEVAGRLFSEGTMVIKFCPGTNESSSEIDG